MFKLQAIKLPSEPPVMALLYSKEVDQESCNNGSDSNTQKKKLVRKRRSDSTGTPSNKVCCMVI